MIWKHENNVLVIIGGWNPNILLDVGWLKRYLFPQQDDFKVEMPLNLSLPGPPQISTNTVKLTLVGAKLSFAPMRSDPGLLDEIEDLAKKLADFLPHTPVSAIGVNFLFEEEDNDPKLSWSSAAGLKRLKVIGPMEEEMHRYSFSLEGCTLNLAIRKVDKKPRVYDFNYHHKISTLAAIKEIFGNKNALEYKKESENYIERLFRNREIEEAGDA